MINRSCASLNPSLWAKFQERRRLLQEPEAAPENWTPGMVNAWMDVRRVKAAPEPNLRRVPSR